MPAFGSQLFRSGKRRSIEDHPDDRKTEKHKGARNGSNPLGRFLRQLRKHALPAGRIHKGRDAFKNENPAANEQTDFK